LVISLEADAWTRWHASATAKTRASRPSLWWAAPALVGAIAAAIEHATNGLSIGVSLAEFWIILVTGLVAVGSTVPAELPAPIRRLLLFSILPVLFLAWSGGLTTDVAHWDWLLLSGIITWLIGVELSENLDTVLATMLRSMIDSGTIEVSDREARVIRRKLRRNRQVYQLRAGVTVGAAVLISWLIYGGRYLPYLLTHETATISFETLAGVVAGQRLGRMAAYGSLWQLLLHDRQVKLRLMPGHPDGTEGLMGIGRFYFRQSLIAGLPASYLAIWWFLIPVMPPYYSHWRNIYLGLLALAIGFEMLAFILPMRSVHRVMVAERAKKRVDADRLMPRIAAIQQSLISATDRQSRDDLAQEQTLLLDWYARLRKLPTWPVDLSLRRWFTLGNIALFVPFLTYVFGNSQLWQQVANVLGGLRH
jgi:hypothetical protein